MKLIYLSLSLVLAMACGKATSNPSTLTHDDRKETVIPVSGLLEIANLYQSAAKTGDLHALSDQIALVPSLGKVPMNKLNQTIGLTPGFGEDTIAFASITPNIPANELLENQLLNQGLAMFHNFHYIDAVRSFQQATQVDSTNAYAKIFLSMAYLNFGNELNAYLFAAKELAEARQLTLDAAQNAWLTFAENYVFNQRGVIPAYNTLLNTTNNSVEALALAGWLSGAGNETSYTYVLKVGNPRHVGAIHYLTHLKEGMNDYVAAGAYAKMLADISPRGAHAQHMYGHVLPMLGQLEEAKLQFLKADQIHKDWAAANNYELDYDWHYSHNNHLLGIVFLALGEVQNSVDSLTLGCRADFRACDGLAKVAVMELDPTILKLTIDTAQGLFTPAELSQVQAYFDKYAKEIDYLNGGATTASELRQIAQDFQDPILALIADMATLQPGTAAYRNAKNVIAEQFQGGGFDSWANGFPNVSRIKIAAEKAKQLELVSLIDVQLGTIIK